MDRTELDSAMRDLAGAQSMAEALRAQQHEFANTLHTIGGLLDLQEYEAAGRFIERTGGADPDHDAAFADVGDIELAALLGAKRSRARELGATLDVRVESAVTPADGDDARDRITIMGNLVDNALEAVGPEGHVIVTLTEREDPAALVIIVEDDGPGIPLADRDAVFRLRQTTKGAGSSLPRGYGLTLVKRIAVRMGGSIVVDESIGGGARFTVTLPRVTVPERTR